MAEKDFTREFMRGLHEINSELENPGIAYKIEDVPLSQIKQKGTGKKPFDVLWFVGGQFHAIELKQEAWSLGIRAELTASGPPTPGLRKHQEENLMASENNNGWGWVVCHFIGKLPKGAQKKHGVESLDRAVAVPIRLIVEERISNGATSLDFDWFLAHGIELPRVGNTASTRMWNAAVLLEAV